MNEPGARSLQRLTPRGDVQLESIAVVHLPMGIWGNGKSSRSKDVMRQAATGLCDYRESPRP